MEGDISALPRQCTYTVFLSTPSGWRATSAKITPPLMRFCISIHALRVEGDADKLFMSERSPYFYPRPPGGGRQPGVFSFSATVKFLSTPSGWRATACRTLCVTNLVNFYPRPPGGGRHIGFFTRQKTYIISIHALRVEGDCKTGLTLKLQDLFLSTPSGWRATAKTDKVFVCFCAKGRRICLFKTRKEKICRWRFKKDKFWVLIWCEGSGKSVCASASHCG